MPDGQRTHDTPNEPFHRAIATVALQAISMFRKSGLGTVLQVEAAFRLGAEIARLHIERPMVSTEVALDVMMVRARELYNPNLDPELYDEPDGEAA